MCLYMCAHVSVCALEGVRYKMFCPNKILHITKNMTQSNILLSLCVCVYACLRLCGVSRYLVLCVCVCVSVSVCVCFCCVHVETFWKLYFMQVMQLSDGHLLL